MKLRNTIFLAALPLLLLGAPAAHAQINFVLTPSQTGAIGDTLTYTGALENQGSDELFLNGDSLTFSAPDIFADDSPFLLGAPFSLTAAGTPGSTYSGDFFTLAIGSGAQPGTYFGTFAVVGGADGVSTDTLAARNFSVTIPSASPAPVPEASTTVSLGLMLALGAGAAAARRKRAMTA